MMKRMTLSTLTRLLRHRQLHSATLRTLFARHHGIVVGMHSYGCFDRRRFGAGLTVGRYVSFAPTSYSYNQNHGLSFLSLHPYFYNPRLGLVREVRNDVRSLVVEDDVWVGHGAVILPSVNCVGRGSVVAAGSVVTREVPRYAVVAGNPARVIKYRFEEPVITLLEESQWWLLEPPELKKLMERFPGCVYEPSTDLVRLREFVAASRAAQRRSPTMRSTS